MYKPLILNRYIFSKEENLSMSQRAKKHLRRERRRKVNE
jgi:hypothetical protein